jgi:hypothetical protein
LCGPREKRHCSLCGRSEKRRAGVAVKERRLGRKLGLPLRIDQSDLHRGVLNHHFHHFGVPVALKLKERRRLLAAGAGRLLGQPRHQLSHLREPIGLGSAHGSGSDLRASAGLLGGHGVAANLLHPPSARLTIGDEVSGGVAAPDPIAQPASVVTVDLDVLIEQLKRLAGVGNLICGYLTKLASCVFLRFLNHKPFEPVGGRFHE